VKLLKPLVFNATPLIYLCKIGLSNVLVQFSEEKYMTPDVVKEVVDKGKSLGAPDAFVVEQLVQQSVLKVKAPSNVAFIEQLVKIPDLHQAEIQVLALAKEMNGIAILDEGIARQVARIYNIEAHGTVYLLLRLLFKGIFSKEQVREAVDRMITIGWRLTAEEYRTLLKELE